MDCERAHLVSEGFPTSAENPLLEISDQEWSLWQHNPLTKAFFGFLGDQHTAWRELAADCLESGIFRDGDPHEDRNIDVLRGKLIAFRDLRGITLTAIQGFYGKEPAAEVTEETEA